MSLTAVSIADGATAVELRLPAPHGLVQLQIEGGATKVRISRPSGTPFRLTLTDEGIEVVVDSERLAMTLEPLRRESAEFAAAADRYDLAVAVRSSA
jgi:hypothetical protein